MESVWINVADANPTEYGQYDVMIDGKEWVGFWCRKFNGEKTWLMPDPSVITHWRHQIVKYLG